MLYDRNIERTSAAAVRKAFVQSKVGHVARTLMLIAVALALGTTCASQSATADEAGVDFNRDIRPILAEKCFHCHGPDANKRRAELRLDTEEGAKGKANQSKVIVAGDPASSELMRRVTSTDDDERMPPPESGLTLSGEQIGALRSWITQGAPWQKHWAYVRPQRPPLPTVRDEAWPQNPIDRFILARLEQAGLTPAPVADAATLARRVSLDLTGLPPTPEQVAQLERDSSVAAYERLVDELLASPHYGERMAVPWLDAARYADSNGYQTDGERTMWPWRDWVIAAFNANMPFDRFTIHQLAGDMLPGSTLDQRIATGFNRNHRGNAEGGIIPAEYAAEYVADRVETTATVWLGSTLGCARCHDHKYDPFTQHDFYRVFALFNQVPERGKAVKYGNSPPFIKAPSADEQRQLVDLNERVTALEQRLVSPELDVASALAAWEAETAHHDAGWTIARGLVAKFSAGDAESAAGCRIVGDEPAVTDAPVGRAYQLCGSGHVDCGDVGNFGFLDKFTLTAWVNAQEPGGVICSRVDENEDNHGYNLTLVDGKLQFNLVMRWLDDALRVETAEPLPAGAWHHVAASYDGSRTAKGLAIYLDGMPQRLTVQVDDLNQSFQVDKPFRIGAGGRAGSFHGGLADVRVYHACLTAAEVEIIATQASVDEILRIPAAERSAAQSRKLLAYFVEQVAPEAIRAVASDLANLRQQREKLVDGFPTTMVMEEMSTPRETFILQRGRYDQPGERVTGGIPGFLEEAGFEPRNRLGLARWLVDPANPLTARVMVNRCWQMYFGAGLVKTADDFGTQGDAPSHPELLDWLADEFIASGWNVKALQKVIVTSATYRQSSRHTAEAQRIDPENRLLSHAPRVRLTAEFIRDQALAASGLLVRRIGGPPVRPYQPPGLWSELTGLADYEQSHGDDLYRRSIYTLVKRTIPTPTMAMFDASTRETCVVRMGRTNTPLQALTLMNDVTYVEAARVLAERMLTVAGADQRIALGFQLVLARRPTGDELHKLNASLDRQLGYFRAAPAAAAELVKVGEKPVAAEQDVSELAAYTIVASMIFNLDEAITKE